MRTSTLQRRALLLTVLFVSFSVACEQGDNLSFVNHTAGNVVVYIDDAQEDVLKPHAKIRYSLFRYDDERSFEVRDSSGTVLFKDSLSWEELAALDWRIVVE